MGVKLLLHVGPQGRQRFLSEVQLLAGLRHPNILLFMGFTFHPYLAIIRSGAMGGQGGKGMGASSLPSSEGWEGKGMGGGGPQGRVR